METDTPLTTQLSWAWIALAIEIDNAFEAASSGSMGRVFRVSLPMWTNGLMHTDEEGVTVNELRQRARAACNLGGLERWGWISIGDPDTRRVGFGSSRGLRGETVLRPTRAAKLARRTWPNIVGEVEERWRARFGGGHVDALATLLGRDSDTMPWSPPEVHPSNGFVSTVFTGLAARDPGAPVPEQLPLVALLGQRLTSLTLEHERAAKSSLPLAANVLRLVGNQGQKVRDLPRRSGLSKEGIAMAVGFLERHGMARSGLEHSIQLTPAGRASLEDYWHRVRGAHDEALLDALAPILHQPEALSAGLVPPEGCWRGEKPYLAQTHRLVADPLGSLPWQPMVLHRGGWPDAS